MKNFLQIVMVTIFFLFSGCASNSNAVRYEGNSYKSIKQVLVGEVIQVRHVIINDDGIGKILGAFVGAVVGSTVGGGNGSTLATVGGGILGSITGEKLNENEALELTVTLDNGKTIVIVTKETNIYVNDRVRIVKDGNEVAAVQRL